ncbi:Phototropin-2 [Sphaceloma murrayae]|uniref:Phototropin-2 n=1 Tax=Sphaceloma murrayae TaxID=2082308 RepID=A0A2K1QXR4_9PEZI|nr:Phototropin-2 [Sphaceloma murrayae]
MGDAKSKTFSKHAPSVPLTFLQDPSEYPYRPSSAFSHSQLVPERPRLKDIPTMSAFGAPPGSRNGAISPDSVFDGALDRDDVFEQQDHRLVQSGRAGGDDIGSYDLKPPPPKSAHANVEDLALRFFSSDHLDVILRDQKYSRRFLSFLQNYKPNMVPLLTEYLSVQKAAAAVEYANAVAESLSMPKDGPTVAASLDESFHHRTQGTIDELVGEALPGFITHRLVQIVTDTLVKEITGQGTPLMREMIPSLAEVYCVSDPSLPDNPIVYASEEFYNTSQYGKDYAIGRNCRFLQGPKTSDVSVRRLIEALKAGQECTETLLNYRRDGTPFLNLLMIAPLYDNKGTVRYFLGCQIDASSMIEHGRGFESFERLLAKDRVDSRLGHRQSKRPAEILAELSAMLNNDELTTLRNATHGITEESRTATPPPSSRQAKNGRRILGMDDDAPSERALWPDQSLGPSGRLPGVYQNYLLVRPYPSLRITFTSPALRIPGLLQTKFMERIGGPPHVREGILDAMSHGTSVTAKINWIPLGADRQAGGARQRWIHCTPLLGSDDKVGVWMIVMVENEEVTGRLNRISLESGRNTPRPAETAKSFTSERMYQDYLRHEGRSETGPLSRTSSRG